MAQKRIEKSPILGDRAGEQCKRLPISVAKRKFCFDCDSNVSIPYFHCLVAIHKQTKRAAHARQPKQEGPPIGGAVRNATSLIPHRLSYIMIAITFCKNVRALPLTATTIWHRPFIYCIVVYLDKTAISRLRDAYTILGPLEPQFFGIKERVSNRLQRRKWSPWNAASKTANLSRIGWTIIETQRPELDPK